MADYARGAVLRELRSQTHLAREKVAAEVGVTTKTLYEWENDGAIKWENAKKIAAFYGVEPETLVTREEIESNGVVSAAQLARLEAKVDEILDRIATHDDWTRQLVEGRGAARNLVLPRIAAGVEANSQRLERLEEALKILSREARDQALRDVAERQRTQGDSSAEGPPAPGGQAKAG